MGYGIKIVRECDFTGYSIIIHFHKHLPPISIFILHFLSVIGYRPALYSAAMRPCGKTLSRFHPAEKIQPRRKKLRPVAGAQCKT